MRSAIFLVALALASRCAKNAPNDAGPTPASTRTALSAKPSPTKEREVIDWIGRLGSADVDHEGLFLDVGTRSVDARRDRLTGPFDDVKDEDRDGATFGRVLTRRLAYHFALLTPMEHATVSLRAIGAVSRKVSLYVDDRRLGVALLSREAPSVVSLPVNETLAVGDHLVTLRFGGIAEGADEPFASVDWLRIGPKLESEASYAPPTMSDLVTDVVLGGVPKRSIVLRADSTVRNAVLAQAGMKFRTSLGYWGNGHGTATIRVLADGDAPRELASESVAGGPGATWTHLVLDLTPYAGRIIALALGVADEAGSGRVAFGEPEIAAPSSAGLAEAPSESETETTQVAVLIVAAGLDRRMIPPWGSIDGLPAIGKLSRDGVSFNRYRAVTTMIGPVFASALSGLSPSAHGLGDASSRLDDHVRLLGERVRESSVHSAMFTGVPMTFGAFGFDRGWDRYEALSPVRDIAASEPLTRGATWLKEQLTEAPDSRTLLVVHTRGGHPPWDVTKDEVATLPPEEYSGPIEPRAGAIILSNLRNHRTRRGNAQRLSGADWRRTHALEEAALRGQDLGVRRVMDTLERLGVYDRALVVFMGDVATGDPPGIPFAPVPPLREDVLLAPLIVKFPNGALAGKRSQAMVTTMDVTTTLIHALGADADRTEGVDLLRMAKDQVPLDGHALVATLGMRYATRFGSSLLSGDYGRRPTLCRLDVDPACTSDASETNPIATEALWRETYRAALRARALRPSPAMKSIPVSPDADTQSALRVFGY